MHDLGAAKQAQAKRFAQIVRYVKRERAKPPSDFTAHVRRDFRLAALLAEYETASELVGMIDIVRDIKMRANRARERNKATRKQTCKRISGPKRRCAYRLPIKSHRRIAMMPMTDQTPIQENDGFRRYALAHENGEPFMWIELSETLSVKDIEKIFRGFVKLLRREGFGPTPLM
jgi:hypothetical protein